MQRQVGQDDAEAVGEVLDDRLELAVAEHRRVQQRERRPGARLAVGDARAVGGGGRGAASPVSLALARLPAAERAADRAPASPTPTGRSTRSTQLGLRSPLECPAPRRAAPMR